MSYEGNIDTECLPLCNVLNKFKGIDTFESCCGHDEHPFRIWFTAANLEALPPLLYFFDG